MKETVRAKNTTTNQDDDDGVRKRPCSVRKNATAWTRAVDSFAGQPNVWGVGPPSIPELRSLVNYTKKGLSMEQLSSEVTGRKVRKILSATGGEE